MDTITKSTGPSPPKALIADSDLEFARRLSEALAAAGFEIVLALDGERVLEIAHGSGVDVAFLDLRLPKIGGLDCLRRMREGPKAPPAILVAEALEAAEAVEAMKRGAYDCLAKPGDLEALIEIANKSIRDPRADSSRPEIAERLLRESEARKRAILESALDCIITIDGEGQVLECNPATMNTLGYRQNELIGAEMATLIFPPALRDRYRRGIHNFLASGDEGTRIGMRREIIAMRADHSEFPAELAILPILIEDRKLFTAHLRDITERVTAEQKIAAAHDRMKRDLEAAARIQRSLLPAEALEVAEVGIAWDFEPCEELAGDILNVFHLAERCLGLYLLDVSGHGVAAALQAAIVSRLLTPYPGQSLLVEDDSQAPSGRNIVAPSEVLSQLNERFPVSESTNGQYFTMLYGTLDLDSGLFRYSSAGHPNAILKSASHLALRLEGRGFPIGFVEFPNYEDYETTLKPADRLYLYSDGLTETANPKGRPFGLERLLAILDEFAAQPLEDVAQSLMLRNAEWRGNKNPQDDISLLGLEWRGRQGA